MMTPFTWRRAARASLCALLLVATGCTIHPTEDPGLIGPSVGSASTSSGGITPTAQFQFSPTAPSASLPVVFDASASCPAGVASTGGCASSTATITSYAWDFGDGTTATGRTPSHYFTTPRSYSVSLTVQNSAGGSATASGILEVGAGTAPSATFLASPTPAQIGTQINFDASQSRAATGHRIVQYQWNFGDGSGAATTTGPNQHHVFTVVGTFSVTLSVTDEVGQTGTSVQSLTVTAAAIPILKFTASPSAPTVSQSVQFDASASTAAAGRRLVQYQWNWGDGSALTLAAVPRTTHAWTAEGSYTVTLTGTDDAGQSAVLAQTVVIGRGPVASFGYSPSSPRPTQSVQFDASASLTAPGHSIVTYMWNWGDGTAPQSTASPLAAHAFSAIGEYRVSLSVTDDLGRTAVSGTDAPTVKVAAADLKPTFVYSPQPVLVGATMFVDASETQATAGFSITSYQWNWGDGSAVETSASPRASHVFTTPQSFVVLLTVTDGSGATGAKSTLIAVTAP